MVSSSARKVETKEDWLLVATGLRNIAERCRRNPRKRMHKGTNWTKAFDHMAEHGHLWLVDGYLVYFDLGTPWYSDDLILSELLIVRVGPGGTLAGVVQFLREQARAAGADFVAVGTAFASSDRALARLYQAAGATPEAITLTMDTL